MILLLNEMGALVMSTEKVELLNMFLLQFLLLRLSLGNVDSGHKNLGVLKTSAWLRKNDHRVSS